MPVNHLVLLILVAGAKAHFIWLRDSCLGQAGCFSGRAVVTFAEAAGSAESPKLLKMVKNKTHVFVQNSHHSKRAELALTEEISGEEGAQLAASIPFSPPFSMTLSTVFGLFGPKNSSLLVYTASASEPTRPSDWLSIQRIDAHNARADVFARLSIDLRDPFMSGAVPGEGVLAPPLPVTNSNADECAPGVAWQDDDACVVAVVSFNGTILAAAVNISLYVSVDGQAGTHLRTVETRGGVTVVRLPPRVTGATFYYAKVNFLEPRAGIYESKPFTSIDHWATTSAILDRPPKAPAPPPPSPSSPPPPNVPPYPVQPSPPTSPPPDAAPWWIHSLSSNSFGGAFGAIFLWLVLMGLGYGGLRMFKREALCQSCPGALRRRFGGGRRGSDMNQGILGVEGNLG